MKYSFRGILTQIFLLRNKLKGKIVQVECKKVRNLATGAEVKNVLRRDEMYFLDTVRLLKNFRYGCFCLVRILAFKQLDFSVSDLNEVDFFGIVSCCSPNV